MTPSSDSNFTDICIHVQDTTAISRLHRILQKDSKHNILKIQIGPAKWTAIGNAIDRESFSQLRERDFVVPQHYLILVSLLRKETRKKPAKNVIRFNSSGMHIEVI